MVKRLKQLGVYLFVLLFSYQAVGQAQFIAKADRYKVGKHEDFTVTFSINEQASGFVPPAFKDFQVLQGPSQSQSTVMRNFQMEFTLSITYVLRPRKTGTLTIEPARIKVGKETLETKPLEITVVENSPRSEDPNDPNNIARKGAYPRVRVSKRSVYVGEPFVAAYQLVNNPNIGVNQPNILELPEYAGAYKGEIKSDGPSTPIQEVIDGQPFQVFTLLEHLIIPQKSGDFNPGKIVMEIPTQIPTNQYDFFGRRYVQTVKQIGEARFPTIEVKPLPTANKPADFSGAVGQFKMDVKLSRKEVKANESVSLEIRIQGFGNIKLVDVPTPELPATFDVFDPKITEKVREFSKGMEGSKVHEYLLLPRFKGTYKFSPIRFSFFDPVAGRYQTLTSEQLVVEVTEGPDATGASSSTSGGGFSGREKERVDFIARDILHIKSHPGDLRTIGTPFLLTPAYQWLFLTPFVFMVFLGLLAWWFNRRNRDTGGRSARMAMKSFNKDMALVEKAADEQDVQKFYAALERALWGYLGHRFDLPRSLQTMDNLQSKFQQTGMEDDLKQRITQLLARCEQARYMPALTSDMRSDLALAKENLAKIQKS
jgi:hypothetical protein